LGFKIAVCRVDMSGVDEDQIWTGTPAASQPGPSPEQRRPTRRQLRAALVTGIVVIAAAILCELLGLAPFGTSSAAAPASGSSAAPAASSRAPASAQPVAPATTVPVAPAQAAPAGGGSGAASAPTGATSPAD
jgi:hypothetical protein